MKKKLCFFYWLHLYSHVRRYQMKLYRKYIWSVFCENWRFLPSLHYSWHHTVLHWRYLMESEHSGRAIYFFSLIFSNSCYWLVLHIIFFIILFSVHSVSTLICPTLLELTPSPPRKLSLNITPNLVRTNYFVMKTMIVNHWWLYKFMIMIILKIQTMSILYMLLIYLLVHIHILWHGSLDSKVKFVVDWNSYLRDCLDLVQVILTLSLLPLLCFFFKPLFSKHFKLLFCQYFQMVQHFCFVI